MTTGYPKREILATGRVVYVGVDVHKDSWHVTARTEREEIFTASMPAQYVALRKLLDRFKECTIKVAYEAGPCGFWLYDKLCSEGIEAIVVPPSPIPVESGNKVKTDKRDSHKLANLLENNMLKRVYVLTEEDRAHRELIRTRRQISDHRTDVMRQIKSKLLFNGIASPFRPKQSWSSQYVTWLKKLSVGQEMLRASLDTLIDLYEYLTEQLKNISRKVVLLSRSPKYASKMNLLKTIPGVGTLIGIEILVELQDVARFSSAEKIASYIGLTPSEFSSGQYVHHGKITRCGNKRVRTCLVESSWILISKDPFMRNKYQQLKYRKGGKRAIIAIARILIMRIRRILLTNEPYVIKAAA